MSVRERFGCFFALLGLAIFPLFALPIWNTYRIDPGRVSQAWWLGAASALVMIWLGFSLFRAGEKRRASTKPPSLAASLWAKLRGGKPGPEDEAR